MRRGSGSLRSRVDDKPRLVPELTALRRMREARELAERLKREREIEKAGGPKASIW